VLIGATWARWPFDAAQLPHIPYPMPTGEVTHAEANAVRKALRGPLAKQHETLSPCYEMKDFPVLEASRTIAFRESLKELARFQKQIIETRLVENPAARAKRAEKLVKRFLGKQLSPALAMELLLLMRDCGQDGWKEQLRFLDALPESLRTLPKVLEQRALAAARLGDHQQAISAMQRIIEEFGDTAERRALLGSRWRRRFLEAEEARARGDRKQGAQARRYLDWAIEEYERGMLIDLNDCECLANLPRLLRRRGGPGDHERATRVAHAAMLACERKRMSVPHDEWIRATWVAAAFDASEPRAAREGVAALRRRPPARWLLDSTLEKVDETLATLPDGPGRPELEACRDALRELCEAPPAGKLSRSRRPPDPAEPPSS
jgi:tetratricopeptide (TPR) repeat protein